MLKATSGIKVSSCPTNVLSLLDFCKGVAIVWIFLFHYQKTWFGWQGVHIFIVLSGFGLTYSCLNKQNISWKNWYIRRSERVLPAYWLVVLFGSLIGICLLIFNGRENVVTVVIKSIARLVLDISLLRNFSHQTIFNYPIDPLWFVPLIVGFYVIFPWLYTLVSKYKTAKGCLLVLIGAMGTEFIYRAISIYWLDGYPIGFEKPLIIGNLSVLPLKPLDRLPDTLTMLFQLQAPFGLFLSRIAEFVLGMLGAIALVENEQKVSSILFSYRTAIAGVFIWLAGYTLVFVGLWEWVFCDFIIALGLVLWVINLAWICQQKFTFLFLKLSQLGIWSYYVFLTHGIVLRLSKEIEATLVGDNVSPNLSIIEVSMLGFLIAGTWAASWLLMKFDKSRFPKLIIQNSVAKVLQ